MALEHVRAASWHAEHAVELLPSVYILMPAILDYRKSSQGTYRGEFVVVCEALAGRSRAAATRLVLFC